MVIFDTNVLIALTSGRASKDDIARINELIAETGRKHSYVGIPAPVLGEYLAHTEGATSAVLAALDNKKNVRTLPFDKKAAVQCAEMYRKASGKKRGKAAGDPYQKVKVDRQIVAIAVTNGAQLLVSDDVSLLGLAVEQGLQAVRVSNLPLPASARQGGFEFEGPAQSTRPSGSPNPTSIMGPNPDLQS